MTPSIGRIVLYRSNRGLGYQVPAIVTATQDTVVDGVWTDTPVPVDPYFSDRGIGRAATVSPDGKAYHRSDCPQPEDGRVHLKVFTPGGGYDEFNVAEGDGPGQWSWPTKVG